ncbi:MAG TPA: hypothetical protein VFU31_17985 [Candidatus Binatia bacterium]|nr:hypothetical protein [Candidatus Binatia bacterium]
MNRDDLTNALKQIFPSGTWPRPLHILQALSLADAGTSLREAAKAVGTTHAAVKTASEAPNAVREVLGIAPDEIDARYRSRAAQMLGQLLLGRCAEIAFERIYKSEMHSEEFELRDLREGRTDTDYRLYNGRGRPIYRVNIKFHGSPFRRAPEMVGLDSGDCFALATYKIYSAIEKQKQEGLPYFFAIVGVPNLTGESVGRDIPPLLVETVALVDQAPKGKSKRDLEDAVVHRLVKNGHAVFQKTLDRILSAEWYVLSARRADKLLRELLFDRVFALRMRSFARVFGRAELDMHFSLTRDLIPLKQFLATLREGGPQRVTTLMERGDY